MHDVQRFIYSSCFAHLPVGWRLHAKLLCAAEGDGGHGVCNIMAKCWLWADLHCVVTIFRGEPCTVLLFSWVNIYRR